MAQLLQIAVFLPLFGALLLGGDYRRARLWALVVALAVLGITIDLVARHAAVSAGTEAFAVTDWAWLGEMDTSPGVRFSIALDGLSVWLFAMTSLLVVTAVLIGWEAIREQASLYYRLLLVLETGMLGVFVARDIILFYVFFEFTLIPLFFLIGIWGGPQRRRAASKFFLFTLVGSVLTFLGLLAVVLWNYYDPTVDPELRSLTFSIPDLTQSLALRPLPLPMQLAVFGALFAGFAIKTPLFPLHTWLPLAHVEAPTAGSVLLAGVLLKVGVYGFARFSLPMLPGAAALLMPWLMAIAVAGILYGALVAMAQNDIKRLIAYSSVSHMGICMLGLFALDRLSVEGGVLQMVAHGLTTGGLFAVVGMIYDRYHTRQIDDLGGLARRTPVLAFFAVFLSLSGIALPGLGGFPGEFLVLLGAFQRGWTATAAHAMPLRTIAVLSLGGVILGAWYMLGMCRRVFFGPLREPRPGATVGETVQQRIRDLSSREIFCLAPLAAAILWIGLQPGFFLSRMAPTLDDLMCPAMRAWDMRNAKCKNREKSDGFAKPQATAGASFPALQMRLHGVVCTPNP